jgi:hypothetical protein
MGLSVSGLSMLSIEISPALVISSWPCAGQDPWARRAGEIHVDSHRIRGDFTGQDQCLHRDRAVTGHLDQNQRLPRVAKVRIPLDSPGAYSCESNSPSCLVQLAPDNFMASPPKSSVLVRNVWRPSERVSSRLAMCCMGV